LGLPQSVFNHPTSQTCYLNNLSFCSSGERSRIVSSWLPPVGRTNLLKEKQKKRGRIFIDSTKE